MSRLSGHDNGRLTSRFDEAAFPNQMRWGSAADAESRQRISSTAW
jgi:hypothetical protein